MMGTSLDTGSGASTGVAMTSGLDPAFLKQSMAQAEEVSKCANMTFTIGEISADATLTLIDGVSSVPGAVAYETQTVMSTGQKQAIITAQAVSGGVLISVVSMGGASREEAVSRAGAMMDQAAALLK